MPSTIDPASDTAADCKSLAQARDMLLEAPRYATSDPTVSVQIVGLAVSQIASAYRIIPDDQRERLIANLTVACKALRCDPDVFRSYCYAVSHELLQVGSWRLCRSDA